MQRDIPIIEPRQRFNVTVEAIADDGREPITFIDAGFQVAANGTLSISTADGKQAAAWASGFWATVEVTANDG